MNKQLSGKSSSPVTHFNQPAERLFPLDLLKAISITAVVSYHSIFVPRSTYTDSILPINMLFATLRFCVPVLFTISFLLFERGLTKHYAKTTWPLMKKRLVRLIIPTVFWFGLAAGLKLLKGNALPEVISAVLNGTIFQGAYYLLVMLQFVPVFVWLRHWFSNLKNVLVTILLQGLFFLLLYTMLSTPFETQGLAILRTIGRPLVGYWFVYMALGSYLWKNWSLLVQISTCIPINIKVIMLCLSCLLLVSEEQWLFLLSSGKIPPFDYAMFSCILSVFIVFLCFASIKENQLPLSVKRLVLLLSKYSLGIFCINGIMSEVFLSFGSHLFNGATFGLLEVLAIKLIGWALLLTFSLKLSILLDRVGLETVVC